MKNFEHLQIGDQITETDEIQHRGHWESVKEYGIAGKIYGEGMKRIRRAIERQKTERSEGNAVKKT